MRKRKPNKEKIKRYPNGRPIVDEIKTKEEGFIPVPVQFRTLTGEQFQAAVKLGRERRRTLAKAARDERIALVVLATIFEHKRAKDIAAELNITPGTLACWKWAHREELDAALSEAVNQVNQTRAGAALSIRLGLANEADEAVKTVGSVMRGTAGDAALATSKLKAAFGVVDHIDPPSKGGNTVNVNVFSEKAVGLMRSLNEQDLTPRRPRVLPKGNVVDAVEVEVIDTKEEAKE